jgi:hypothetical protein
METKGRKSKKIGSKESRGSKGGRLGRPPKASLNASLHASLHESLRQASLHEEIEMILEPSPTLKSNPPFFLGDSVVIIKDKWYVDQAHMFRSIVLPYTNAFAAYSAWIGKDVAKYYCHILLNDDDIDFEIERGHMGVCILHEECRLRNGRSDACSTCLATDCFCSKVVNEKRERVSVTADIFGGSQDDTVQVSRHSFLTAKDLIMQERERAFLGQIGAFSSEVQRTMCCEFWDALFKAEEVEGGDKSTVQAQMLWRAWARRRHGLFFLRNIYNVSVTPCAAIPIHWEAPSPTTLLV